MPAIVAPTLTDGTVTVRPLRAADASALTRACQDPEIPRWTRVPRPYTLEDARAFIAAAAAEAAAGLGVAMVVADAGDGLLGTVGLMEIDRGTGSAELGYWLAGEARGRGAATRAVRLVAGWAARELGLRRLEILTHPGNGPSARVAQRAGFAATGETRRVARMPPGRRDGYLVHVWTSPPGP